MLDAEQIPVVSVVINTYNHVNFIASAIESALMQKTNFPFEIIIGDDESDDGAREICIRYANEHPGKIRLFLRSRKDVIYINNKPTGRFNFIRNIKSARGKYIALLPGDDYWTDALKLQKQVDLLEQNPDCVACHHWHKIAKMSEDGTYQEQEAPKEGHGYYPEPVAGVREIFADKLRLKSRTLIFRNLFKSGFELPEWFLSVQFGDVPLSMILGQYGKYAFIDESMAVYRMTGKGVSTIGIENPFFTFSHFIEWIRIWEYGDVFFKGKYHREALTTVYSFYQTIFNKYKYSYRIFRMMARYALSESQFPRPTRIRVFTVLLFRFIAGRSNRLFTSS